MTPTVAWCARILPWRSSQLGVLTGLTSSTAGALSSRTVRGARRARGFGAARGPIETACSRRLGELPVRQPPVVQVRREGEDLPRHGVHVVEVGRVAEALRFFHTGVRGQVLPEEV